MSGFIEIDFIEAGESRSGDAIAIRRRFGFFDTIYVVDGGYAADGMKIVDHVHTYYDRPHTIDHVVLTHPDVDHATGLETVLREFNVGCLWMNRPWRHVETLMTMFKYYQDRRRLADHLRAAFPRAADLEEIAHAKSIPIRDAFQSERIGDFTVLSPRINTYLRLVVESDATGVSADWLKGLFPEPVSTAPWGEENLKGDTEGTSAKNESSIVQFADVCGMRVLLTGDAGTRALDDAFWAGFWRGERIFRPDCFQVPHHGSRRNVSSAMLDTWLGPRLSGPVPFPTFNAIISANLNDGEHPKSAVVRALHHRGARVLRTDGILRIPSFGAPARPGWYTPTPMRYPSEQEV